jgi:hypothetical protein
MGDGLGDWRIDWTGNYACLMGPKSYQLEGQRPKMAGVPVEVASNLVRDGHATYEQERTILTEPRTLSFKLRKGIVNATERA